MDHFKLAEALLKALPVLGKKIASISELNFSETKDILTEVLRFMQLVELGGERLTPSQIVDLAWHEFILFTKAYSDFCVLHFGRFIHHYPGENEGENKIGFKKLHYYYEKHFGFKPNPKYWGTLLAEIADASDCGV